MTLAMRSGPYESDHARSVRTKATERAVLPSFRRLIRWFVEGFELEYPEALHGSGPWVGRQQYDGATGARQWPVELVGGSALGSPRWTGAASMHLEGSDFRTEHASSNFTLELGETYATPMRATITWLERNGHPFKAGWLRALGRRSGDWQALTLSVGWDQEVGEAVTRDALGRAWIHFREDPR